MGRVVFVAGPNAGTILADADHLGDLVDRYTNLLAFFPDNEVTDVLEGVITVVKQLAVGAVKAWTAGGDEARRPLPARLAEPRARGAARHGVDPLAIRTPPGVEPSGVDQRAGRVQQRGQDIGATLGADRQARPPAGVPVSGLRGHRCPSAQAGVNNLYGQASYCSSVCVDSSTIRGLSSVMASPPDGSTIAAAPSMPTRAPQVPGPT